MIRVRGSLRKFLDTRQLSTIIENLPLHFLKVLSLNHDSKHWCQSLSSSAQSSPWYTVTVSSSVKNRFPCSRALTVGNRKKSPRYQVWTVRRMGQQLHGSPPQKIHCQMGGMGRGIVMVQLDAPKSSSWALFSQFFKNLSEGNCGVPLCSLWPLILKLYCCHMSTCSKERGHYFLPNTFCSFHFDRSIIIREHPDRRMALCFWITLANPGLFTCNDLRIAARVPIVESPKHFTATIPLEWSSDCQRDCGTQRDDTLLTLR